ncbi:MAG TPA: hypothetical protein PKM48_02790 [Parvularculaceae bacterium]|nr:hypothetical protein [Parvularculaceae bacterium]
MAYTFNHDLLLNETDVAEARKDFPNIVFALHNPALKDVFRPIDQRAGAAKRKSRQWGVLAVGLATLALMLAAGEVLYHDYSKSTVRLIALLGAIAGITSVFIGVFGVMFRARKIRWLADRLTTERLRQFHFQHYVAYASDILDGAAEESKARAYLRQRAEDFKKFKADLVDRADDELNHLVHAEDPGEGLIFGKGRPVVPADAPNLDEYFNAYRVLRFDRQIGYCDLMLRERGAFWTYAPVRQAKLIGNVAMFCVFAILVLHGLVFVGAIADIPAMKGPAVHVAAIWAAIIALAARTIEEGFQPETEIERLRQYRLSLRRIYDRFETTDDPQEKLRAMTDLEKLSFEEMILFLRGNYEAQYVM